MVGKVVHALQLLANMRGFELGGKRSVEGGSQDTLESTVGNRRGKGL